MMGRVKTDAIKIQVKLKRLIKEKVTERKNIFYCVSNRTPSLNYWIVIKKRWCFSENCQIYHNICSHLPVHAMDLILLCLIYLMHQDTVIGGHCAIFFFFFYILCLICVPFHPSLLDYSLFFNSLTKATR